MKKPTFSIITPVFNREHLIKDLIECVARQSFSLWELIIVDDQSNDNTLEIAKKIAQKDERIKVFVRDKGPKGANTCRNIGLKKTEGQYLIFLDSDDIILHDCLEYRFEKLNENPGFEAWIFPTGVFKEKVSDASFQWNKLITPEKDLPRFLRMDAPWDISGPVWNLEKLNKGSWFNENTLSFQDWEMHSLKLIEGLHYFKVYEGPDSIKTYYRRTQDHDSISKIVLDENMVKNRNKVYFDVFKCALEKKESESLTAVKSFLIRYCSSLQKRGLHAEAKKLWLVLKYSKKTNSLIFYGWWYFVRAKSLGTPIEKLVEFLAYRVLKKDYLLNQISFQLREPIR